MAQGKQKRVINPKKTVGGVLPAHLSDLSKHAIVELSLIKEDSKVMLWYVSVLEAYAAFNHTIQTTEHTIGVLNRLMRYENLAPLTDEPLEWVLVGTDMWQSTRNFDAFSNNGGKTYKLYSENNDIEHKSFSKEDIKDAD